MIEATTLSGHVELPDHVVRAFAKSLTGVLLLPADDGYADARAVWNRMIDRRPALIARCAAVGDVVTAVRFAREHNLLISVKGGGHNVTGHAVCDGGLMIDLSPMREAHVDPRGRRVVVGPGATWKDVDSASLRHGLATTGGIVSSTGVAGLTLGGGHGWLMRKHGLACDNLAAVELVTADGVKRRASADEHPDLFWGLRGGGGNFGIVTSFEFQLHPLDTVLAGLILHPLRRGRDVLERYRDVTMTAPDELVVGALVTTWFDGTPVIALAVCYSGRIEIGECIVEPAAGAAAARHRASDTVRRAADRVRCNQPAGRLVLQDGLSRWSTVRRSRLRGDVPRPLRFPVAVAVLAGVPRAFGWRHGPRSR